MPSKFKCRVCGRVIEESELVNKNRSELPPV